MLTVNRRLLSLEFPATNACLPSPPRFRALTLLSQALAKVAHDYTCPRQGDGEDQHGETGKCRQRLGRDRSRRSVPVGSRVPVEPHLVHLVVHSTLIVDPISLEHKISKTADHADQESTLQAKIY